MRAICKECSFFSKLSLFWGVISILMLLMVCISCESDSPTESNTTSLTKFSGDGQTGAPGDTLPTLLVVLVTDSKGKAISGQWIDFSIIEGDASLIDTLVVTNEIGKAETTLILGSTEGEIKVEAKLYNTDIETVFTVFSSKLHQASLYILNGNNQWIFSGGTLRDSLQVIAKGHRGNPLEGLDIDFYIKEGEGTLSSNKVTTSFSGIAGILYTAGDEKDSIQISASITGMNSYVEFTLTIAPNVSRQIAFRSYQDGDWDIFIMDDNGANRLNLTNSLGISDFQPTWSPDGLKIAFYSTGDGNSDIFVMNSDGTNKINLINSQDYNLQPTWSPDGTKIAYVSDGDIIIMDIEGKNQHNLTNLPDSWDSSPNWSPDGLKIAFCSQRDGGEPEIYVMNSDGTNQTRLTNNSGQDNGPSWSPDGTKIAYVSDGSIFIMDIDGTNQTNICNSGRHESSPSWLPDGNRIVYSREGDIFIMDIDGSNQINISNNEFYDDNPSWSPF